MLSLSEISAVLQESPHCSINLAACLHHLHRGSGGSSWLLLFSMAWQTSALGSRQAVKTCLELALLESPMWPALRLKCQMMSGCLLLLSHAICTLWWNWFGISNFKLLAVASIQLVETAYCLYVRCQLLVLDIPWNIWAGTKTWNNVLLQKILKTHLVYSPPRVKFNPLVLAWLIAWNLTSPNSAPRME